MTLLSHTYGKGRVRIMRVQREGDHHEVRELTIKPMLTGDFSASYDKADNRNVIATDSIKNIVNLVAREQVATETEPFLEAIGRRFLERYPQVTVVETTAHETRWLRLSVHGAPHPHSFTLDGNGTPFARVSVTREKSTVTSGIEGFTFLKSTQSGWSDFLRDDVTTLPETRDRLCGTSLDAAWTWASTPADYRAENARVLHTMLEVFAGTYSDSVQDSLYRMGEAALAAVSELSEIRLAAPNKHYIPINFAPFGLNNGNAVFLPTDEPHGQIECVVGRV